MNVILLISFVMILMNMEQTFRAAVGTMRWRIKFVVLALGVIFGARLYVRIQAILFSGSDVALWSVESGALLIGCAFLVVAYARTGLAEIDVYPSLAVLRSSLTILIVGAYLFVVGVLAQVARRFGGARFSSGRRSSSFWEWRAWPCCCSQTAPARESMYSSSAISARPSTTPPGSGRCARSSFLA